MGHRLSKIYTRTGDAGTTGLGDGGRVAKHEPRIRVIGDVDELNASLGLLLCEPLPEAIRALLTDVQHNLFDLGGELSVPGMSLISDRHVKVLENQLDHFNAGLPPLKDFILPGGTRAAALAHLARTICRRAEREAVALHEAETLGAAPRAYLNRLSDLLFVLGRELNRVAGHDDVLWQKGRNA